MSTRLHKFICDRIVVEVLSHIHLWDPPLCMGEIEDMANEALWLDGERSNFIKDWAEYETGEDVTEEAQVLQLLCADAWNSINWQQLLNDVNAQLPVGVV